MVRTDELDEIDKTELEEYVRYILDITLDLPLKMAIERLYELEPTDDYDEIIYLTLRDTIIKLLEPQLTEEQKKMISEWGDWIDDEICPGA